MLFSSIKSSLIKFLKKIYLSCKEKFQTDKVKVTNTPKQKSSQYSTTDQNDLKYIQILLYYVQDSKLFNVSLPESESNTASIVVEFLEFSPGFLKAYIQVTELCFAFSSAVVKIILQLTFGFLVMLFIFCVDVVQKILSKLVSRKLDCAQLKGKLVPAFIFTVLFSYQKLVIGCFALVQCVDIRNQAVLFLQGDIHCYTWWQICILVYICISVVPIFFILGHAPFFVKDKEMSVRTFILACLFPFPVMMWYHLGRFLSRYVSRDIPKKHEVKNLEMVEISVKHYNMDTAKEIVERVTSFNEGIFLTKHIRSLC